MQCHKITTDEISLHHYSQGVNHENLHLHRQVPIFSPPIKMNPKRKEFGGYVDLKKKTEFTSPVQLSGGEYLNFLVKHKNYFVHP